MRRVLAAALLALAVTTGSQMQAQGKSGLKGKPGDDAAATKAYVESLAFGDDYAADAIVDTDFTWGSNTARIRIVPMTSANTISWANALGIGEEAGDGQIVAKLYNKSNKVIGPLGLPKNGTAYLWVGEVPGNPGERGAAIYALKENGEIEQAPKKLRLGGFCAGQHDDSRVELTDGKKCTGPYTPLRPRAASSSLYMFASMKTITWQTRGGSGLWVTCQGGCCEVQYDRT